MIGQLSLPRKKKHIWQWNLWKGLKVAYAWHTLLHMWVCVKHTRWRCLCLLSSGSAAVLVSISEVLAVCQSERSFQLYQLNYCRLALSDDVMPARSVAPSENDILRRYAIRRKHWRSVILLRSKNNGIQFDFYLAPACLDIHQWSTCTAHYFQFATVFWLCK